MKRRIYAVVVLGLGLTFSSGALAAAPGEKEGMAKFKAGQEALSRGRLEEALTLFEESRKLHESAGVLLNIAYCEQELGRPASALKHFREGLALLPSNDSRVRDVKTALASVEPHVPKLRVTLQASAPASAKILVDGAEKSRSDLQTELALDPGKHTLSVSAPGRVTRTQDVMLTDGQHLTVEVGPGAPESEVVVAPVGKPTIEPSAKSSSIRPVLLIGGGVLSGAAIVVGAIGAGLSVTKAGEADSLGGWDRCYDGSGFYPECYALNRLRTESASWANVATGMFIGGVVLGTAVVLYGLRILPPEGKDTKRSVLVEPLVSPSGGGLVVRGAL